MFLLLLPINLPAFLILASRFIFFFYLAGLLMKILQKGSSLLYFILTSDFCLTNLLFGLLTSCGDNSASSTLMLTAYLLIASGNITCLFLSPLGLKFAFPKFIFLISMVGELSPDPVCS